MDTNSYSRDTPSQAGDVEQRSPPYPLTRGAAGLWLRRGERLGRAACWITATVAVSHKRIGKWRRQVARSGPIDTPPQPG